MSQPTVSDKEYFAHPALVEQAENERKSGDIAKDGIWYQSELFGMIVALSVVVTIIILMFTFPETSKTFILWVFALYGIVAVVVFMLEKPILLILALVIILAVLGYFFTKAFIGTLFVGLGICFLLTRPYWVGLVLAVAGAIILLHKSC